MNSLLKDQILSFQKNRKSFAYFIDIDENTALWILIQFIYDESLFPKGNFSDELYNRWLLNCAYSVKEFIISKKDYIEARKLLYHSPEVQFKDLNNLVDFLSNKDANIEKIVVSI